MTTWYAVFKDRRPGDIEIVSSGTTKDLTSTFGEAAEAGTIQGREVMGMWLVDHDSEQDDVVCIHGIATPDLRKRHAAYLESHRARE